MHVSAERNATIFRLNRGGAIPGARSRRWAEFLQQKRAGDCLNDGESDSNIRFCLPFSGILRENPTHGVLPPASVSRPWLAECGCRMLKETGALTLPENEPFPAIREIHRDLP